MDSSISVSEEASEMPPKVLIPRRLDATLLHNKYRLGRTVTQETVDKDHA